MAEDYCPACGQRNSWGCGHSGEQRRAAKRHNESKEHRTGACLHYSHTDCGPECKHAGDSGCRPGFMPMLSHQAKRTRNERMV